MQVLQRADWQGNPKGLGEMFRLQKTRCGQSLDAICRLLTHILGCELRLEIAGTLNRSQVCRTQEEVLDAYDSAHTAILDTFHGRGLLLFGAMGSPMRTRKRV